jgi:hypothetical protein
MSCLYYHDARAKLNRLSPQSDPKSPMPSLFRFLFLVAVVAGAVFVGMAALVAFVEPAPREISQPVAPANLNK